MNAAATTTQAPAECAHCGGPLGADPRVDPASGRAFCCYGCRVLGASGRAPLPGAASAPPQPWFRIGAGALVAGQSMVLGLAANVSRPDGPERWLLHGGLIASAAAVAALLGPALVRQACACARDRRVAVEWLFLAGIAGAAGASLWSTFTGRGAVYYEVVAVLLTVHAAGKALTAATRGRAVAETRRLRDVFARARRLGPAGETEDVEAAAIEPGDLVLVRAGEAVPVDGTVERGESLVRETPMTGEGVPAMRRAGDAVLAGSFAEDGELAVRATSPGRARRLDAVLAAVEAARGTLADTGAQRWTDRIAAWFLPAVLGASAATFAAWAWAGRPGDGLFHALSVLLVACPCALGLATPLALWHGLAVLAARGIVVRSAAALERAASVRTVFLDKTGTLGAVEPVLADFVCDDAGSREALLSLAAAVQERSSHPLARPFRRGAVPGHSVRSFRSVAGQGVEAWVVDARGAEHVVRIGRREWIAGDAVPPWAVALRSRPGDHAVAVAVDGVFRGLGAARESARDGARECIAALRALGCEVVLLSGDRGERVAAMAGGLGAGRALGGLSALEKSAEVARAKPGAAMVGDGVNDAAALAAADVGFAVGGGAALAEATADVVLAGTDLGGVAAVLRTARSVRDAVRSSIAFAVFYNLLGMGLAAAGLLHPVAAALLMVGSSAVVSWRALRPGMDACASDEPAALPGRGVARWAVAGAFLLQVPWTAWLGQLAWPSVAAVSAVAAALAAASVAAGRGGPGTARAAAWASLAMLGPGNLLMLVGWWIDAGFGPVMRDGACLCCRSHQYFQFGGHVPWMHLGMLLGGLPAMARASRGWKGALGRAWMLGLGAVGMVAGMGLGADLVLRRAGPGHPHQFLLALGGMSVGMLAGMGFLCAVGEAAAGAWRSLRRR